MHKVSLPLLVLSLTACTGSSHQATVSDEVALARLNQLEQLDEREYQKARVRGEEQYQTQRERRLDSLADQKIALENERIHYQNQGIQYQNHRQATRDAIDDYGRVLMHEANAINKANENRSKKRDVYIQQRGLFY